MNLPIIESHPCARLKRRITSSRCDLELLDWNPCDKSAECARCPYNPTLDFLTEEAEDEPP